MVNKLTRAVQCAVCLVFMIGAFVQADELDADRLFLFDITPQNADQAILALASQSQQSIIFSYQLTQQIQANPVNGFYTFNQALIKLLSGTGLSAQTNAQGQLAIVLTADTQTADLAQMEQNQQQPKPNKHPVKRYEKIAIVGSRNVGRTIADLPVPVDSLPKSALMNSGQTELGRMLQSLAPSFNFSSSAISDGTDAIRPATLRGLGPDQTLVLVNGKRRHQASLIHINSTVGRGTAGTDINAIPASAIKRVEILRDGAAAQYGSDAIAGVINIVLNDHPSDDKLSVNIGQYRFGDGRNQALDLTKTIQFSDHGFFNTNISYKNSGFTNRAGVQGSCLFDTCTKVADHLYQTADMRELTASRQTFRIGDGQSEQYAVLFNGLYQRKEHELYGFFTYSSRQNQSAAFFREQANLLANPKLEDGAALLELGYLPKITANLDDISANVGIKTELANQAIVDLSYTYGENRIDYQTSDSINASYANFLRYQQQLSAQQIRTSIPRHAFAYGMALSLATFNIDYRQDVAFSSSILAIAAGAELRRDQFRVLSGQAYAYTDYDTVDGVNIYSGLSGGVGSENADGGMQGFPGIAPESQVNEARTISSIYLDLETEFSDNLLLNSAIRLDHYLGFGHSTNVKLAANWRLADNLTLRAAINTGFRAPSMQQLYFNNVSTQFVVNEQQQLVAEQIGTFRNDSELAQLIGIPALKQEQSNNWSLGFVAKFDHQLALTIDYYAITIEDRIVISNRLGKGLAPLLDQALITAGAGKGQFFLNGANTHTRGLDIVATWTDTLFAGELLLTLTGNITNTQVTDLYTPARSSLAHIAPTEVFSAQDISIIEHWQPEHRISFSSLYQQQNWSLNLTFNRYGAYRVSDGGEQHFGAKLVTDLRLSIELSKKLALHLGANNLFDIYPDKNRIANSGAGTIIDNQGKLIVASSGVFDYSRRSAPFGFNGAFYYLGLDYRF